MSKKDEIVIDWYLNDVGDEIMISIRTEDGRAINGSDIVDGAAYMAFEQFHAEVKPVTAEDIKNDIKLH